MGKARATRGRTRRFKVKELPAAKPGKRVKGGAVNAGPVNPCEKSRRLGSISARTIRLGPVDPCN